MADRKGRGPATGSERVHAGFIPLLDCAPLVVARELGFDRREGFELVLHREVSWANIRDKVDLGVLDCAHMLAPMPLAAALGLGRATKPLIAPMGLSLNGNAITVSRALHSEMLAADSKATEAGGMAAAAALRGVVLARQAAGREPLTLGMVYPFSAHNYDLRCWLAAAGTDPDNDVNLIVVPPPLVTQSLKAGRVDGFSVGSPWNSVAVADGDGVIVATKDQLWPASPEKVLGVGEAWATDNADLLDRLIRVLIEACRWLDEPGNRGEAAALLARPEYVGVDSSILLQPLSGVVSLGDGRVRTVDDMILFHRQHANVPRPSHAVWFLTQMVRWGQAREPFDIRGCAERVYRPDLFARAIGSSAGAVLRSSQPDFGVPFFGGDGFDPDHPLDYLAHVPIRAAATDFGGFRAANPPG